ncbi:MAG: PAS domain S-box protein [Pontiellaceae bacterium]|nr:PAS domain S-box protein [Pontiellaceae bacterium]
MKSKTNPWIDSAELRRSAEARLETLRKPHDEPTAHADTQRLLHELQVHQIELEMQNDELQTARDKMELLLEKYTDLYDFAPVGYFSLDARGRIMESNLKGALLLGVNRSELIEQNLPSFITEECRPVFLSFLDRVFAGPEGQSCEVLLVNPYGIECWVACHGTSAFFTNAPQNGCRVAVSDITAPRQVEDTQRQINTVSIENKALLQEIIQRTIAEQKLRKSEQQKAELLDQSNHLQEQLRSLSRRVLTVQEEERSRISRELHDEATQTLISIIVHLEALSKKAEIKPAELRKNITLTQEQVEKSIDIVYRFVRELRPPVLDDLGLIPALKEATKRFMKDTGIRVVLKAYPGVEKLDSEKRTTLYRVAQEALANVARHAHASRVAVTIKELPSSVHLQVKDNGCSFDLETIMQSKEKMPLGLLGMRERMEMVGGTLSINSSPDSGTIVHALVPLETAPNEKPGR